VQDKEYESYFQVNFKDHAEGQTAKKTSSHPVRDRRTEQMWDCAINLFPQHVVLTKSKILGRITLK